MFRIRTLAGGAAVLVLTTSCSLVGGSDDEETAPDPAAPSSGSATAGTPGSEEPAGAPADPTVTLLTHDSFSLPERVTRAFTRATGYEVDVRPSNGVGQLVNLVATEAGNPSGDVVFGVDNTFGSRVLDAGAVAPADVELPDGVAEYALAGDDDGALVPVDTGGVCVNVDDDWFEAEGIAPPQSLDDLLDPAYEGLFVTPGASTSSPGLAFLLTTIAEYGDDWPDYWRDLVANGAEIAPGWSEAYYGSFTQGEGDRPIVLSYDSSPAFTVGDGETESATSALLDTCFQQVEYAGVLEGTDNPDGARALVEFLLGREVQEALPTSMFVFPVVADTPLPADWAEFAERPADPFTVDPAEIEERREEWLLEWTDVVSE